MCPIHQHCRDIIAKAVEKFGKVDVLAAPGQPAELAVTGGRPRSSDAVP
jgi:hypothetical protein